jgi:hypothetical protein
MTTRRPLPAASAVKSMINKSSGGISIQSFIGAAATISDGAKGGLGAAAKSGRASIGRSQLFIKRIIAHHQALRNPSTHDRAHPFQRELMDRLSPDLL